MIVSAMIASLAFAQKVDEKTVPSAVKQSLQKQFSGAQRIKWEQENGNYEAEFVMNKTELSACFDATGMLIETEEEIPVAQLPQGALDYVKANHARQKAKEAARITAADGVVTYEAEVKGKDLVFDNNGKFIREKKYQSEKE